MSGLTIFAAPPGMSRDILAVLQDWSEAGLVQPFWWLPVDRMTREWAPLVACDGGLLRADNVASVLAAHYDVDVVRLVVVDPLRRTGEDSAVVTTEQETMLDNLVRGTRGYDRPPKLLRCVVTVGGADELEVALGRDGAHTLIVSPETSADPTRGIEPLRSDLDTPSLAAHAAAALAGVGGLWRGLDEAPFDELPPPPVGAARVVRSHLRWADGTELDDQLRSSTFSLQPEVPRPRGEGGEAPYFPDEGAAAKDYASVVLGANQHSLRGQRVPRPASAATLRISWWKALTMLFSFLGRALLSSPAAWARSVLDDVKSSVARSAQNFVFGDQSAYAVLGSELDSAHPGAAARSLDAVAGRIRAQVPAPLFPGLWHDYRNGAMDLLDAGGRLGSSQRPGADQLRVGGRWGVVQHADRVVPAPGTVFQVDPALVDAVGRESIEAFDFRALSSADRVLDAISRDPASQLKDIAAQARQRLQTFHRTHGNSYAVWTGTTMGQHYQNLVGEYNGYAEALHNVLSMSGQDNGLAAEQSRLRAILGAALAIFLGVVITLCVMGWLELLTWGSVAAWSGGALLVWLVGSFFIFMHRQRRLFQLMNAAEQEKGLPEYLTQNMRLTMTDIMRTLAAYEQFLEWTRILGTFVHQPFGAERTSTDQPGEGVGRLPKNVRLGRLVQPKDQAELTRFRLRERLYSTRWLDRQWDTFVRTALGSIGPVGLELLNDPGRLGEMHPDAGRTPLEMVARRFAPGEVPSTLGDPVWEQARQTMETDRNGFGLAGAVVEEGDAVESQDQFLGRLADPSVAGLPLSTKLFAPGELVNSVNRVEGGPWVRPLPASLGLGVVRVEYTAALSPQRAFDLRGASTR